ncbi:MAG: sigma factor-like helix-turn-helix DNA-binding protein [Patescibacteria group bacterium]
MENSNDNNKFQELFVELLSKLSEREQDVLKQRYHLVSELTKKSTLKQIGDIYNITRERVRQIEREAIRKVVELTKTNEFNEELTAMENDYVSYLKKQGGLVREDRLLENYIKPNYNLDFLHSNAFLFVLEHVFDSTEKVDGHDHFYSVWTLKELDLNQVVDLISKMEATLTEDKKLYNENEIIDLAKSHLSAELKAQVDKYLAEHNDLTLEQILSSYLDSTSKVEKNIMDNWGLSPWETIRPKKLGDKIQLIFNKSEKPLHFRDIAEVINNSNFDHKKICPATVHNELIANEDFVLIGRGIYALKGWGYTEGTVFDIIKGILEKGNDSMTKDEIYDEVLKQRQVNKSTIYLTLINKDKFTKDQEGKFALLK